MGRSVFRKPSLKKSLSAKYKGAYKRKLKKKFIPGYGTRTAGWLHPKRKMYNKLYYRTSLDTRKVITGQYKNQPGMRNSRSKQQYVSSDTNNPKEFNRLQINNILKEGAIDRNPRLGVVLLFLIQAHRFCHYLWILSLVMVFVCAFIGLGFLVTFFVYLFFIAVVLRLALPIVINILDLFVKWSFLEGE